MKKKHLQIIQGTLPYGRQSISKDDIQAVVDALRSDFITTGPRIADFEDAVADFADAEFAVAVSSGTAALHCAAYAVGVKPGDEVIVPAMTFAASANCVRYLEATPVFADSLPDSLLISSKDVERKITPKTKVVIAVDYAGQPCDYDTLREICDKHGLRLIADACHSIGATYKGRKAGDYADIACFSFHPVKHITTGEGGMAVTNSAEFADKMRLLRNHGITTDFRQREEKGGHFYEMVELGFNYRITDFQCALGRSQLLKLPAWLERRREIAARYDKAFADIAEISPLANSQDVSNAYHLYVVRLADHIDRDSVFRELRKNGIGVNVHYIPVHLHPYYKRELDTGEGLCPVAEEAYKHIISLPMFPTMSDEDIDNTIKRVAAVVRDH